MNSTTSVQQHVPPALPHDLATAYRRGVLLRVEVGSRLHGFSHSRSDHDYWVVVPEPRDHAGNFAARKAFQAVETLDDGTVADVTVLGLSTFMRHASNGAPQALDVMYAPTPDVDLLGPMRQSFRVNPNEATASYRRMMGQIVQHRSEDRKQRRHAFRLALNLHTLLEHRRFNPVLTDVQKQWVLDQSADPHEFVDRLTSYTGLDFGAL